ncbi:MAG: hypothetical protein FJX75_06660 [Armatimonadetes bacterium]|nr:hypothetical protein [Armatimonadota bacterium]
MIRFHQHAALLITKDAEALTELTETDSARSCIGPRLSPTVAWIDHRRVDVLREALARAGYAPKMARNGNGNHSGKRP